MSTAVGLVALVVLAADVFVEGLLGVGRRLGVAPFVLTVALSGFETENLAVGIATNASRFAAISIALGTAWIVCMGMRPSCGRRLRVAPQRSTLAI
jgi:hypothetical protein